MEIQENTSPHEPPVQIEKETHRVAYSGPLVTSSKTRSTSFNKSSPRMLDQGYVEVTLDIREDDTVLLRNIKAADPGNSSARLTNNLERKPSSTPRSLASQMSFKFKQVSHELKRMKSSLSFKKVDRTTAKPGVARALNGLKFMTKNVCSEGWPEIETRFDQLSDLDGTTLPKLLFAQCIGMKDSSEFACELFDALARRRGITSCCVTKEELREFWEQISDHSFNARLQTFFDMVDKNADGRISEEEVKEIITLSASANNLSKIIAQSEEYAALIMEELDRENLGYIDLYNLQMLLLPGPDQFSDLDTNSRMQSRLLSEKLVPTKEHNPIRRWCRRLVYFVEDNWRRIWVIALWLLICTGLFAWKFFQYKQREVFHIMGYCVSIAKGGAETLKFNMALILLPVCRNTITWLRSETKLGFVVPFDDNINFHKVIAFGILVGVGLHAGSHLTCDFPKLLHSTNDQYDKMKPFFGHKRPENYWWFVKGTEGWTGLVMVVLMLVAYTLAQPWFRRNRLRNLPKTLKKFTGFNAFWYSHHLFLIVYILFIVHGYFLYLSKNWDNKTTWMYLVFPIVMYACERVLRAFRSGYESVKILKVAVYPGNVLALHMSKPQGFKYTSGQYIYLNCSDISSFQWHPFSITSAPGDDYLSVHIRTLGDWTSQLKYIFSKVCQPPSKEQSGLLRADIGQPNIPPRMPRLRIDGPYGAPAQDYKEYEVILLVGLGIGATPLISIVKDVLNNIKQQKEIAAQALSDNSIKRKSTFATKRAYFYWITREQGSFEWFRGVMNEVAENDLDGVIELHNHCTSVYEEGDARSALITMLQSIHHAKNGVDVVSGTRVKTHFARPNWRNVFKHVALKHPDQRVGVFYCGAHGLVGELKRLTQDFSRKTETKFDFHKENF